MPKKGGKKQRKKGLEHVVKFEKEVKNLSEQEMKELLLINMYKMKLVRAQMEALTNALVKNRLTTQEEIWKETNENFQNSI